MQNSIVKSKMKSDMPDIYVKPKLRNIRVLEFHRFKEIMDGVDSDISLLKEEITGRMKRFALPF